ncbi:MAG: hypothetical protein C0599_01945 [Salinivirgaceae bacterium]|nr:MAG: hypothetical protein C0599_01945 [Salinivirgaceae bacterium]
MKKIAILVSLSLVLFACNNTKQPDPNALLKEQVESQKTEINPQLPVTNDSTLVVNNEHAIIFMADSLELNEIAEKYGPEALAEAASDISYYAMTASDIIDSLDIETTICDKKYIILIKPDNSLITIERKKVQEGDLVLYKPGKEPLFTFAAGFEKKTAIEYFEIKN